MNYAVIKLSRDYFVTTLCRLRILKFVVTFARLSS
jgi:hypothetical protein